MSITKFPGHMRSLKLNFSATVLTLGLKVKIFDNLRLCQAKVLGELRTRPPFDRCVCLIQFDLIQCGRRGGLMVSALVSGSSGPGSSPGRGHCVVFLGKTLYSHSASLHPGL